MNFFDVVSKRGPCDLPFTEHTVKSTSITFKQKHPASSTSSFYWKQATMRRTNEASNRRGHAVTYESRSHWKVITQMWGSVWPKVCSCQFLKRMVRSSSTMALLFLQSGSVSSLG